MHKPVVHGLIAKRSETVARIAAMQEEMSQLLANLDHLDASLRIFDPDIDFDEMPVKRVPPPNAAFRGEVQRFLLEALRTADGWLTTDELAVKVMDCRRMNKADKALRVLTRRRTGHSLTRLRRKGLAVSEKRSKAPLLSWRIVSPDAQIQYGWRNGASKT